MNRAKMVDNLNKDRSSIYSYYINEMYPVKGMKPEDIFSNEKECSSCGEVGWVPRNHRFLCIFCWVTDKYELADEFDQPSVHIDSGEGRWIKGDLPRMSVGIENLDHDVPDGHVVYTITYPVAEMSQEELEKLVPSNS